MTRFLEAINKNVLAMLSAIALVGAGWGGGMAVSGFVAVPKQIAALSARTDSMKTVHVQLEAQIATLRTLVRTQLCLDLADREHTDWRRCELSEAERLISQAQGDR